MKRAYGFTIVELLIVIVVIAILAALSYVGYTSMSQRANNVAIIDAAAKTKRIMESYVATQGECALPGPSTRIACITADSGCHDGSSTYSNDAATILRSNAGSIAELPRSVPTSGSMYNGISVTYWSSAAAGPLYIRYYLQGLNQDCGLSPVLTSSMNSFSTIRYTSVVGGNVNKTHCAIRIEGPPHSG